MIKKIILSLFISLPSISTAFAEPGKPATIDAQPIEAFLPSNPAINRFIELEFLGGLVLTSDDKDFGGLSGIRLLDESRFLAVSDKGKWFSGEIKRQRLVPTQIENVRTGRLRDAKGKKLDGKKKADAESIEISDEGYIISFERDHRALLFSFVDGKLTAASNKPLFRLKDKGIKKNEGPEGIALVPRGPHKDTLLAFPENAFDKDGNLRVFMFRTGKKRQEFSLVPSGGFSLTDAAFLPNGDLLVLERAYSIFGTRGTRIRKFRLTDIEPGALLAGSVILVATGDYEIDNMEGLAVSSLPNGDARLTLISDDNFSKNQRTLLLEFRLPQ